MRYVIIGAGAVGGAMGGKLFEHGHEVVLVARGEHAAALRADGLRLVTPDESVTLRVPVVSGPDELTLRPDDVLVLAVKSQDTVAALDAWADAPVGAATASARLPVVCAQNGVANERVALRRFREVYGMCVWLPGMYLRPGEVIVHAAPMTALFNVGRYPSGGSDALDQIAADLTASQMPSFARDDVMRWKYGKLLRNLGNGFDALFGSDTEWRDLFERAVDEGVAVLDAAGIAHTPRSEEEQLRKGRVEIRPVAVDGQRRPGHSAWQSMARGTGSVEVDYLNGEIAMLGREYGVPTPVNEAVQCAARRAAVLRRAPGSFSRDELDRLIDELSAARR